MSSWIALLAAIAALFMLPLFRILSRRDVVVALVGGVFAGGVAFIVDTLTER